MTNEEAIRLLRCNITAECLFCDGVKNFGCNSKCLSLKALDIAIEAIKKQTVKKPYRIHDNIFHCGNDDNCDAFFTEADEYRYCPFC